MERLPQTLLNYLVPVILTLAWGCAPSPAVKAPAATLTAPAKTDSGPARSKPAKKVAARSDTALKPAPAVVKPDRKNEAEDLARPAAEPATTDREAEQGPRRTLFFYDYFPDSEVYFDTTRHLYFYRENGTWTMSVALPSSFREHLERRVRLELTTAEPFRLHADHVERFPPDKGW